jgi:hypothetical protein
VNVDWWLERTHLSTIDATWWRPVQARRVVPGPLRQAQLLDHVARFGGVPVSSSGTRSRGKRDSFFLESLPRTSRPREMRPSEWVTYVHSYPNEGGGVTLQYWRAYAWNDARFAGLDVGHGGDWEAVAVHLDATLRPLRTSYFDHTGIVDCGGLVQWQETHPLVWSEEGGHSSYPDSRHSRSARFIRHPTWTGGTVTRWDGTPLGTSGGLINVGEKSRPRNGQVFVQYSGLWGSPGNLFMTTGYWGPAFNETDAQCADGAPGVQAVHAPSFRLTSLWTDLPQGLVRRHGRQPTGSSNGVLPDERVQLTDATHGHPCPADETANLTMSVLGFPHRCLPLSLEWRTTRSAAGALDLPFVGPPDVSGRLTRVWAVPMKRLSDSNQHAVSCGVLRILFSEWRAAPRARQGG